MTLGPNLRRVVRAAMAASVVMTSGVGTGEDRRSDSQIESMSVRSQRSESVQRKSAPSRPAGHGPGMMPMRYLIVMRGIVCARSGGVKDGGLDTGVARAASWSGHEDARVKGRDRRGA